MIWPGVQKPHWKPSWAMKAACTGCSWSPRATPSMVRMSAPSWLIASARQELIRRAVDQDGAGAALAAVASLLGSGQVEALAQEIEQRDARIVELDVLRHAVDGRVEEMSCSAPKLRWLERARRPTGAHR